MDKSKTLFECAKAILYDQCPFESDQYICRNGEVFDETACTRCWEQYLYKIINK